MEEVNRKIEVFALMERLLDQDMHYGKRDCHLMFLEVYEPDLLPIMQGRYTTPRGAIRVTKKEFGYGSLLDYLLDHDSYIEVMESKRLPLDIAIFNDHDCAIFYAPYAFGLTPDFKFGSIDLSEYKCRYFRRV
ncbi:hypothetical protein VCHA31O73_360050 [Vibrio chagasii]|nr:hypothetical protein VCHA31O73_360050 [Vibrio chagasii]